MLEPQLRVPAANVQMPSRLSDIGLYPLAPDMSVTPRQALSYAPRFPLWSDGGHKERFVAVPEGSALPGPDSAAVARGTLFFKTFFYDRYGDSNLEPVETRALRFENDGWAYYRYLWAEGADDALLLEAPEGVFVPVTNETESFEHQVPSSLDCHSCHEASDNPVLGYRDIQLQHTPINAAPDELTERVMGYVLGNCAHCHNGRNSDLSSFDMRPEAFLESTIDHPVQGNAATSKMRVTPGAPEESVLYIALTGGRAEDEVSAMPPLGVALRDTAGAALIREWIEQLDH